MPAHYDDPTYDYQAYWQNRDYEHQSEIMAIKSLLTGQRFLKTADIGGGFGRLLPTFSLYSKNLYLLEPSLKLRNLAKKKFSNVEIKQALSDRIPYKNSFFDLVSLIRVSHHLPNLSSTLKEIRRVLKPGGYLLLEFANSAHFKSRLNHLFTDIPIVPVEKRSMSNINRETIAFVNHHPEAVLKLLKDYKFTVEKTLSVSNFRSPFLKKLVPLPILLNLESCAQHLGAKIYFGPSIFILAKKA